MEVKSDKKNKEFLDRWFDNLTDAWAENQKEFDKRVTYIGSGTVAISIAFVSRDDFVCTTWFFIGECSVILSVILNFLSFLLVNIVMRHCQNKLNESGNDGSIIEKQESIVYRCIMWINLLCVALLTTGIVLIASNIFNGL